jgi:hypothetical protein
VLMVLSIHYIPIITLFHFSYGAIIPRKGAIRRIEGQCK